VFIVHVSYFMGRWSTSSDGGLRAKSRCPHLCVRGHGKMSSLPSSCLLPSLFHSSSHAPDHMREPAGSMGHMLGLGLLSCYTAHFLVLCLQYVELRERHCTEVGTAQFPVSW